MKSWTVYNTSLFSECLFPDPLSRDGAKYFGTCT